MIINLTQHVATEDQSIAGVKEPSDKRTVQALLTFHSLPETETMELAANSLVSIALRSGMKYAMIGGAPFFMSTLETALKAAGIIPLYAFSEREVLSEVDSDGKVVKTNIFVHKGFVRV